MFATSPAGAQVPDMSSPAANPLAKTYQGGFTLVEQLNVDTWRYRILLDDTAEPLRFAAGQFIQLKANADPKGRSRAYSIASPPAQLPTIELCIKHYPNGLLSGYLAGVKVGDRALLRGPFGRFTLPAASSQPSQHVFAVTGTGIAPVRSMIHTLLATPTHAPIMLIQGHRQKDGLFYRKEFAQLATSGKITYVPIVSAKDQQVDLPVGYVTDVLGSHTIDQEALYYLCGNPAMVRDASLLLRDAGVPLASIRVEKW